MKKSLFGVEHKSSIKAKTNLKARLVIDAIGNKDIGVSIVNIKELSKFLIAPVIQGNSKSIIKQQIRDGWDRIFLGEKEKTDHKKIKPIIISCRTNWTIHDRKIHVLDTAYIIDGARFVNALLENSVIEIVPIIIIFNLTETQELEYRLALTGQKAQKIGESLQKVGTNTPRLTIDSNWVELIVQSDPFVIKTGLGYTAAITVKRNKNKDLEHLIVGAKSLSTELEIARQKYGSLIDLKMSIKKESDDQKSAYTVHISKA